LRLSGPDEHFAALGKVAMAASRVEEAVIVYTHALTETLDSKKRYLKNRRGQKLTSAFVEGRLRWQSWAMTTVELRTLVKVRFKQRYRPRLLKVLKRVDELREKRNDAIHGLWQVMQDEKGTFVGVYQFSKRSPKRGKVGKLSVEKPKAEDLEKLATDLGACFTELQSKFRRAFDLDEKYVFWAMTQHRPYRRRRA
jgi:hypothetical protein